jgi:hypothetical protein
MPVIMNHERPRRDVTSDVLTRNGFEGKRHAIQMQSRLELSVSPNSDTQFDLATDERFFDKGIGRIGS